jgi:putative flippase GtrA
MKISAERSYAPLLFAVNGVVATMVHFGALSMLLEVFMLRSAGLANLFAAALGISTSFVGNRYVVFRRFESSFREQALRFGALYVTIAVLHGLILTLWTDIGEMNYRAGFVISTLIQVSLSYWGSKRLVFDG